MCVCIDFKPEHFTIFQSGEVFWCIFFPQAAVDDLTVCSSHSNSNYCPVALSCTTSPKPFLSNLIKLSQLTYTMSDRGHFGEKWQVI